MQAEIIYCPFGYDTDRWPWSIVTFTETPKAIVVRELAQFRTREDAEFVIEGVRNASL